MSGMENELGVLIAMNLEGEGLNEGVQRGLGYGVDRAQRGLDALFAPHIEPMLTMLPPAPREIMCLATACVAKLVALLRPLYNYAREKRSVGGDENIVSTMACRGKSDESSGGFRRTYIVVFFRAINERPWAKYAGGIDEMDNAGVVGHVLNACDESFGEVAPGWPSRRGGRRRQRP